jgi:endonuclease YncB( thermonuclease family)
MRRTILALLLFVLPACDGPGELTVAADSSATKPGESVQLVAVLDGDSFVARRADGTEAEVRLLGINAPEGDECLGDDARNALQQLLGADSIRLTAGPEESDQFGRLLRYVATSTVDVNLAQLEAGLAIAMQTGHEREADFLDASQAAVRDGRGMWAMNACGPPAPQVAIVDYVYDPPGRDEEHTPGEWVALVNESPDPIDFGGWTLRDESTQNRFRFPAGVIVHPGQEIVIRSGCGDNDAEQVYWCAPSPVWSNGGDTIMLLDRNGTIVTWERYLGNF